MGATGMCRAFYKKDGLAALLMDFQMANSSEVLDALLVQPTSTGHAIAFNYLVPNVKGLQNFFHVLDSASTKTSQAPPSPPPTPIESAEWPASNTSAQDPNAVPSRASSDINANLSKSNTTEISVFAAATEAFSKANLNCSIAESLERFRPILLQAKERNIRVRGYVSVALGCPYEGPKTDPRKVAEITSSLLEMGADEVSVADTTGMGTAPKTRELLKALSAAGIVNHDIALHFHDTYGQALVNTVVGLEHGIRIFDSSVGGLGGCPYSKGATGNVATEDLVYCLHSLGVKTGIDTQEMAKIGAWISEELGKSNETRAGKAILARLRS
ncbi:MAG: hypothetical protein GOMPHAMPRED_006196 [Gomphillus americanus]|uniref:hydroxymethylglutaryl-CoA lyase n=1 Tax=Gomphillus americanus TaxID=1940652 RepID=A0A8H3ICI4_9LECA|nr:MAG: hypothetical protein GOMPHAMPRED_006196 [Gomphillus americanus]